MNFSRPRQTARSLTHFFACAALLLSALAVARNALRGPGFWQSDLIFNKRIPLTETVKLEFRTEIFNIFNHANFANPSSTLNVALPTLSFNSTANAFVLSSGLQPGQAFERGVGAVALVLVQRHRFL